MRLFVAVNLPAGLRREIRDVTGPLRAAGLPVRWVEEDGLHLTLKFLGETRSDTLPAVTDALEEATRRTRPIELPIGDFGAFPSVERPRVIWVGCDGVPSLELLQHRLEQGMEPLGFPIEGKPFRPHVTLGRVRKDAGPAGFRGLATLLEGLSYQAETLIESVDLVESRLGPGGSRYRTVHSAVLSV
jgi:2'-5' RNA ligase